MSLIDRARNSEVRTYQKLLDEYDSLCGHAEDLERQLEEAREAMCIYVREHRCEGIENDDDAVIYFKNTFNEKNYN